MGMIHISLQAATNICLWQKSHTACLQRGDGQGSAAYVAENRIDREMKSGWRSANRPTTSERAPYFFLGGRVFGSYVVLASNIDSLSPEL